MVSRFDCMYVKGDATEESVLSQAGIERAKGLVISLGDDHEEVYLTMTARQMNPQLTIYARINQESARKKFLLAGANVIVNPQEIGGMRIASTILRPKVVKFLEEISNDPKNLRLEEIVINEKSELLGKAMDIQDLQRHLQARIIAVKKASTQSYEYYFRKNLVDLAIGDCIFVLQAKENGVSN